MAKPLLGGAIDTAGYGLSLDTRTRVIVKKLDDYISV